MHPTSTRLWAQVLVPLFAFLLPVTVASANSESSLALNLFLTHGSGNPGATNVLRSGHKSAAVLTLLLDAAKGWLPVWAVVQWGGDWGLSEAALAFITADSIAPRMAARTSPKWSA